uniref:Vitelline coat protein 41 n=1 Tax=Tegula pfeifferi TaxID=81901 RepID=Q9GV70_TEGPF|nr:vitelline coat protein 41 [Omphalius pfeifferi]
MASLSTVVYFIASVAMTVARIPDKYILKVTPFCGSDVSSDARIEIVTDLVIEAQASCAGGVDVNFTSTDKVNFMLLVSYPGQGSQPCVFMKQRNALIFYLNVSVAYGEEPGLVRMDEEEYTVTCTFSPHGTDGSPEQSIIEGLIAPPELLTNVGPDSPSTFSLELVDVLGGNLANENVHLGRTVQLRGHTAGEGGESVYAQLQCIAMDGSQQYAILRGGCGDGIVFPKDVGFTSNGTTTLSPYFEAFGINFTPVIQFKCTFVTCTTDCNGSSCESEARKRRDVSDAMQPMGSESKLVRSSIVKFYGAQPLEAQSGFNMK